MKWTGKNVVCRDNIFLLIYEGVFPFKELHLFDYELRIDM